MKYTKRVSALFPLRHPRRCGTQGNPALPPGIEGVEVKKVYYIRMRNAALFASAALLLVTTIPAGAQQSRASSRGSVLDAHEGLTVTAEPWTSAEQYKEKFHKKSPLDAGIIAIRVSFRNDTNESIRIALSRIRLSFNLDENNHQELPPMKSEDVADAILKPGGKDPTASRSRIPLPIPTRKSGGRDKKWTELKDEAEIAGVRDGVVAPHSTTEGLLYFDLAGQFDLLSSAHLYIPELVALETNHPLMYFDLDLNPSATH